MKKFDVYSGHLENTLYYWKKNFKEPVSFPILNSFNREAEKNDISHFFPFQGTDSCFSRLIFAKVNVLKTLR